MIKVENLVPEVYYKESRDFQFIARIYEILFNYIKTNSDLIRQMTSIKNIDDQMLQLLAKTLGFTVKHNYDVRDLRAVCSAFVKMLKWKGTKQAIQLAVDVLLNSQNIAKRGQVLKDNKNPYNLNIYIPYELTDIILLEDIFDYILPAGWTYSIIYREEGSKLPTENIMYNDIEVKSFRYNSNKLGTVTKFEDEATYNNVRPANISTPTVTMSAIQSGTVVNSISDDNNGESNE